MNLPAKKETGLRLIIGFKIFKGLLLIAAGAGALSLLHKDVADQLLDWIIILRVDPDNHYIHSLVEKAGLLDSRKLAEISAGTFFYAALLMTEGIGLHYRKRWAEYFTAAVTASLIPIEIYEIIKHGSLGKFLVLGINIAVVWYLVRLITSQNHGKPVAENS